MYLPAHFEEKRPAVLHAALRAHPLGLWITQDAAHAMDVNPIPFLLDAGHGPHGRLRGHVARGNPVWREADPGAETLVVFQGPQAYVSPNWYPSKAAHGKAVPTWNYVTVLARGRLRVVDDKTWLRTLVGELTAQHEAAQSRPWTLNEAPPDYIDTMLGAIVGIEIELTALQGKWKVSQNRPVADREGVAAGLRAEGGAAAVDMAALVQAQGSG